MPSGGREVRARGWDTCVKIVEANTLSASDVDWFYAAGAKQDVSVRNWNCVRSR